MPISTSGLLLLTAILCAAVNTGPEPGKAGKAVPSGLFLVCILKDKTLKLQEILK